MHPDKKILIFTDLDGTFLDHENYDYSAALPALDRLKKIGADIIPTTSKTLAELKALELPLSTSNQIAENGMVICDNSEIKYVSKSYEDIIAFINSLHAELRENITGFHDMSIEDVVKYTSLSPKNASLAKERLGSEPFLWSGTEVELDELDTLAIAKGFSMTQGGRFYHLMGAHGGKDKAIQMLIKDHENIITIALGDGPNDAEMLAVVDYGIKIPNSHGHDFGISNACGEIIQAPLSGPAGWNASINALLDRLRF